MNKTDYKKTRIIIKGTKDLEKNTGIYKRTKQSSEVATSLVEKY